MFATCLLIATIIGTTPATRNDTGDFAPHAQHQSGFDAGMRYAQLIVPKEIPVAKPPQASSPLPQSSGRKGLATPTISGRVLASDGTPAPGFGIWAVGEDGSGKSLARSGRDGTYEFAHTGGTMRLRAAGSGTARTEPVGVELQPSQSATRDFVLPACGRIVLVIKKPDGTVPDAFDACNLGCSSGVMSDPSMMQRDGDKFVIAYLIGDVYDLAFHVKGFKPVSLPGTVIDKDGNDCQLNVNLEFADGVSPVASDTAETTASGDFCIQIASVSGPNRQKMADESKKRLESNTDMKADLIASEDGEKISLVVGHYPDKESAAKACNELRQRAGFSDSFARKR